MDFGLAKPPIAYHTNMAEILMTKEGNGKLPFSILTKVYTVVPKVLHQHHIINQLRVILHVFRE